MSQDYKSNQFTNYGNNIADKILKYIGTGFIKFCKWKMESITSSMRCRFQKVSSKKYLPMKITLIIIKKHIVATKLRFLEKLSN